MYVYSFSGKILPERENISFPVVLDGAVRQEGSLKAGTRISLSVFASQISAVVHSEAEVADIGAMREKVEEYARFGVDALGYLLGCGLDVEITGVSCPSPYLHTVFGVEVPGASDSAGASAGELQAAFQRILAAPRDKQPCLRRALSDFREAIRAYEDTPFYCFRAIEDLRQYFVAGEDQGQQKSWLELASRIGIPAPLGEYIRARLRPLAIPARHGQAPKTTREQRIEMLNATWKVIALFIDADRGPSAE
jgi:hypothetical protein